MRKSKHRLILNTLKLKVKSRQVEEFDLIKELNSLPEDIKNVLLQRNSMLADIPYMEMNEGTIHKEDIRSALPEVYFKKAKGGVI